jgi:hypothetical protein
MPGSPRDYLRWLIGNCAECGSDRISVVNYNIVEKEGLFVTQQGKEGFHVNYRCSKCGRTSYQHLSPDYVMDHKAAYDEEMDP